MSQLGIPTVAQNLSNDERIELILDLTRKLHLLNELLQGARSRREHPGSGACNAEPRQLQHDALTSFRLV